MKLFIKNFTTDEQGQDLIEYTLLMAFIALASAAIFVGAWCISAKGLAPIRRWWGQAKTLLGCI